MPSFWPRLALKHSQSERVSSNSTACQNTCKCSSNCQRCRVIWMFVTMDINVAVCCNKHCAQQGWHKAKRQAKCGQTHEKEKKNEWLWRIFVPRFFSNSLRIVFNGMFFNRTVGLWSMLKSLGYAVRAFPGGFCWSLGGNGESTHSASTQNTIYSRTVATVFI